MDTTCAHLDATQVTEPWGWCYVDNIAFTVAKG